MNLKVWAIFALGVLIAGAFFVIIGTPKTSVIPQTSSDTISTQASSTAAAASYTLAEVATHNSAGSCWTAINGKVYDVTPWINQHPGGPQAILSLCGTDGSVAFNGQHGGQRRPESELATFYIAALAH